MTKKSHQHVRISKALNRDALEYVLEAVENGLSFPLIASEIYSQTQIYVNPITLNRWVNRFKKEHDDQERAR